MPTKNPRIHVVLEQPLFKQLKTLSEKEGLSMSLEARQLIRQAFQSSEQPSMRIYTGKNFKSLIGKFRLGSVDPDNVLASQVHG